MITYCCIVAKVWIYFIENSLTFDIFKKFLEFIKKSNVRNAKSFEVIKCIKEDITAPNREYYSILYKTTQYNGIQQFWRQFKWDHQISWNRRKPQGKNFYDFNIQVEGWLTKWNEKSRAYCVLMKCHIKLIFFKHNFAILAFILLCPNNASIVVDWNFVFNSLAHKKGWMGTTKCSQLRNSGWTYVQNEYNDIPIGWEGRFRQDEMFRNGWICEMIF